MEDKGRLVGSDIITSNSAGHWSDDMKTFVQYYGNEVRKCTDVKEIIGDSLDNLLAQNGWKADGTKFYFSHKVYSYNREDLDEEYYGEVLLM